MKTRILTVAIAALVLGISAVAAQAQSRIYIRGIPYVNHSAGTQLSPSTVRLGQTFFINSRTLRYSRGQSIRVVLQDTRRPTRGGGVTVFALRSVRFSGSRLICRAPAHSSFNNRSFHVTVYVYQRGQSDKYASAGTLNIRNVVRRPTPRRPITRPPVRTPRRPVPVRPRPRPQPRPTTTVIRGIRYLDHSRTTWLTPRSVRLGGSFRINSTTLRYQRGQTIYVTLQDTRRPTRGGGVTAFRLRNVRYQGGTLICQAPAHVSFRNRTFHVAVFVYQRGQQHRHASAGQLTLR